MAVRRRAGGPLKIWEWPTKDGRYAIGADPAQGYEHGDFSSAHVINARDGHVVAAWHGRIDPDLYGSDVLAPLGRMYSQALIGVESNNHGLTTLKALHASQVSPALHAALAPLQAVGADRHPRLAHHADHQAAGGRRAEHGAARGRGARCGTPTRCRELRTFVRDDAGKMTGSPFDDRTISLSIANQMIKYVWLKQYEPERRAGSWHDGLVSSASCTATMCSPRSRPASARPNASPSDQHLVREPTKEGLMTTRLDTQRRPSKVHVRPNSRRYARGYDNVDPHEMWGDTLDVRWPAATPAIATAGIAGSFAPAGCDDPRQRRGDAVEHAGARDRQPGDHVDDRPVRADRDGWRSRSGLLERRRLGRQALHRDLHECGQGRRAGEARSASAAGSPRSASAFVAAASLRARELRRSYQRRVVDEQWGT